MLYPLSHALAPPCLFRCVSPYRFISSVIISLLVSPFFDTVGQGVRRGASVSCLLGFVLLSVPMSIAGSCRRSLAFPRSACLSSRLGCVGTAFSSRHAGCVAMSSARLVSRLVYHPVGRVGFCVSLPVLRHEGRGGGRMLCCCLLSRLPRACLPLVVSRHQSDTDGGGGLRSIGSAGGLLALPRCIRAVSSLSSRIPTASSHDSFD